MTTLQRFKNFVECKLEDTLGGELWLEFGFKHDDGFEDMLWYNEGRLWELPYFAKHYFKNLFKQSMYFKIRPYKFGTFYLRKK